MTPNPPLGGQRVVGTLTATKAARIAVLEDGALAFAGAGLGTTYGPFDVATCIHVQEHVPPHPGCACGFYGFKSRVLAEHLVGDHCTALLDVEFWGAFHEYELGYVAAVQQVRRVTLQPWCWACLTRRHGRTRPAVALAVERDEDRDSLLPVCDEHAEADSEVFTVSALASAFEVPVRWADDEDPLTGGIQTLAVNFQRRIPRPVRRLDDVLPDETVHVFQNVIAQDDEGSLYINPLARLVQPLPGTDVPLRLNGDGEFEILLAGLTTSPRWRARTNTHRFSLPLRVRAGTERGGSG